MREQGGHGGIVRRGEAGEILQKESNDVERRFYAEVRQGRHPHMRGVIPDSYAGEEVNALDGRGVDDSRHLYVRDITHGMTDRKILDIKVGTSEASRQELIVNQKFSPLDAGVKKSRTRMTDRALGTSKRGYRVMAGTGIGGNRARIGRASNSHLSGFSDDPEVWNAIARRLEAIQTATRESGCAFIGSSILVAVGRNPVDHSPVVEVKLIDFAHMMDPQHWQQKDQIEKYRNRFDAGMTNLVGFAHEQSRVCRQRSGIASAAAMVSPGRDRRAGVTGPSQPAAYLRAVTSTARKLRR